MDNIIRDERQREEACCKRLLPKYICLPMSLPVEMLVHYHKATGLCYSVDADRRVACLTSPFADEDV
jgi:hypothetical protein